VGSSAGAALAGGPMAGAASTFIRPAGLRWRSRQLAPHALHPRPLCARAPAPRCRYIHALSRPSRHGPLAQLLPWHARALATSTPSPDDRDHYAVLGLKKESFDTAVLTGAYRTAALAVSSHCHHCHQSPLSPPTTHRPCYPCTCTHARTGAPARGPRKTQGLLDAPESGMCSRPLHFPSSNTRATDSLAMSLRPRPTG
jgi:hypothetical protein